MTTANPPIKSEVLLFLGDYEDKGYAPKLKALVSNAVVFTMFESPSTLIELTAFCKKRNITGVFSTSKSILSKLLAVAGNPKSNPSLDAYQGSYFLHQGIEFVFISPLKQLVTVPFGSFIAKRFISKLVSPYMWTKTPKFQFHILTPKNEQEIFQSYQNAIAIAVDIETLREDLKIRCIGYTAIFLDRATGRFTTHSCVLPIDSMYAVSLMRKFNWELKAPKIFQNGKYDISYLSRYNAVPYNYLWDTANMFHCWYSELPKDLAFLGAFFVREAMYWKDLADTSDTYEYYRYNALDTWTTALVFIAWIIEAPHWAKRNYRQEFPLVFPCHLSEMTGIKRDMERLAIAESEVDARVKGKTVSLSKMLGTYPNLFNVNSVIHMGAFRRVIGCGDMPSSDEASLKIMASKHPLNSRLVANVLDIRGDRKLQSTYLTVPTPLHLVAVTPKAKIKVGKELNGRILYSISPSATDTGRMASREHHFWCGLQVQNIPGGPTVKQTLVADAGFRIAEADLKQAETRDTAYVSGDPALIAAVNSPRDFHSLNASAFFGLAYETIFDDVKGKTLNKPIRDLSKRTNHGANYLMGESVLVLTMGEDNVWKAKGMLGLPKSYGLLDVANHLLESFHKTYSTLRKVYYPAVVHEVMSTSMLVSHTTMAVPPVYDICDSNYISPLWELEPPEGWTRYCFGDPKKNKLDKNALVAHVSQSLNAMALNVAYLKVFYEIAMNPKYSPHFKLCAQIHDSILFQFREGHEYLMQMVQDRMSVAIKCLGYDGVTRTFAVPADVKAGKDNMGALRWSETE